MPNIFLPYISRLTYFVSYISIVVLKSILAGEDLSSFNYSFYIDLQPPFLEMTDLLFIDPCLVTRPTFLEMTA